MILKDDPTQYYRRRLTEWMDKPKDLEFATKQFKDDEFVHCIVKRRGKKYAVFIKGLN